MERLSTASFGLTISIKKSEVIFQLAPSNPYHDPIITVKGQKLQAVVNVTNFGSTLPRSTNIDVEINNGTSKASSAFWRLRKTAWDRRGIHLAIKLKVYRAVVLATFLYGCET